MDLEKSLKVLDFTTLDVRDVFTTPGEDNLILADGPGGPLVSIVQQPTWSLLLNTLGPAREAISVVERHDPQHTKPYCNCTTIQFNRSFGFLPLEKGWCTVDDIDRTAAYLFRYWLKSPRQFEVPDVPAVKRLINHGYFVTAFGQWDENGNARHVSNIIGFDNTDGVLVALDGGGVGEKTRRRICRWSQIWRRTMMDDIRYFFQPKFERRRTYGSK